MKIDFCKDIIYEKHSPMWVFFFLFIFINTLYKQINKHEIFKNI